MAYLWVDNVLYLKCGVCCDIIVENKYKIIESVIAYALILNIDLYLNFIPIILLSR